MKIKLNKVSALLSLLIGFILIILGSFYTALNWSQISTAEILYKLKSRQNVEISQIESYIAIKSKVAEDSFNGTLLQDLAFAQFVLSKQLGYFSPEGKKLLDSAKSNLIKGLKFSPANGYSWFRLAYINMLLDGVSQDVSDALYMSMILISHDYPILYQRLGFAFLAWDYFSDEQKDTIYRQIRLGWKWNGWQIALLARSEQSTQIIINAFEYSQQDIDLLKQRIAQLKKEGKL